MTTGQWVLLIAVGLAVAFGAWRALTDGRFRAAVPATPAPAATETPSGTTAHQATDPTGGDDEQPQGERAEAEESLLAGTEYADRLGGRATLVQFSSAFCAPCRATRRTLAEVTELVGDVAHVEVDAESQLELVRRVGITRTPTTLVLDPHGREVTRAAGAPTRQQVLTALALVDSTGVAQKRQ